MMLKELKFIFNKNTFIESCAKDGLIYTLLVYFCAVLMMIGFWPFILIFIFFETINEKSKNFFQKRTSDKNISNQTNKEN